MRSPGRRGRAVFHRVRGPLSSARGDPGERAGHDGEAEPALLEVPLGHAHARRHLAAREDALREPPGAEVHALLPQAPALVAAHPALRPREAALRALEPDLPDREAGGLGGQVVGALLQRSARVHRRCGLPDLPLRILDALALAERLLVPGGLGERGARRAHADGRDGQHRTEQACTRSPTSCDHCQRLPPAAAGFTQPSCACLNEHGCHGQ